MSWGWIVFFFAVSGWLVLSLYHVFYVSRLKKDNKDLKKDNDRIKENLVIMERKNQNLRVQIEEVLENLSKQRKIIDKWKNSENLSDEEFYNMLDEESNEN